MDRLGGVLISICVPAYNAMGHILDCINSALEQSYSQWELIIVDDGSRERDAKFYNEMAARDPERIKVFHTENRGPYLARKLAYSKASGDYLLSLDADDCLLGKDALSNLVEIAARERPDIILFNGAIGSRYGRSFVDYSKLANIQEGVIDQTAYKYELIASYELNNLAFKMVKREVMLSGEFRSERVIMTEDRLQVLEIADEVNSIYLINKPLYQYRMVESSTTHSRYTAEMYQQTCQVESYSLEKCREWGIDESVWAKMFQAVSYGAIRSVRESTRAYKDRKTLYNLICNSELFIYAVNRSGGVVGRIDRKIGNYLLTRRRFVLLDAYLKCAIVLLRRVKR